MVFSGHFLGLLLGVFFVGTTLATTNIIVITQLRSHVKKEFHGRIISSLMLFAGALAPISYATTGILIDTYGNIQHIYYLIGFSLTLASIIAYFSTHIQSFFKSPCTKNKFLLF
jgi:hypothetical protein